MLLPSIEFEPARPRVSQTPILPWWIARRGAAFTHKGQHCQACHLAGGAWERFFFRVRRSMMGRGRRSFRLAIRSRRSRRATEQHRAFWGLDDWTIGPSHHGSQSIEVTALRTPQPTIKWSPSFPPIDRLIDRSIYLWLAGSIQKNRRRGPLADGSRASSSTNYKQRSSFGWSNRSIDPDPKSITLQQQQQGCAFGAGRRMGGPRRGSGRRRSHRCRRSHRSRPRPKR